MTGARRAIRWSAALAAVLACPVGAAWGGGAPAQSTAHRVPGQPEAATADVPATDPAAAPGAVPAPAPTADVPFPAGTRSGLDVYARFREGLADPECPPDSSSARWRRHFAHAPERLGAEGDDALALFGYVVDALREASLPTEYALIPFVESGYKPGARSKSGPAGLWQMAAVTARHHGVEIRPGYDGRLSPVDSTRAAVRYLKTLHGMFAGDWRLAVMAYNAGEYRVLGALRRSHQAARDADPEKLTSLSGITRAYVRKLHALSCLLDRADERDAWLRAMDRPIPVLEAVELPRGARDLARWASADGRDAAMVRRLNPALAGGAAPRTNRTLRALAPMRPAADPATELAFGAAAVPQPASASALAAATLPSPVLSSSVDTPADAPFDPSAPAAAGAASGPAPETQAH